VGLRWASSATQHVTQHVVSAEQLRRDQLAGAGPWADAVTLVVELFWLVLAQRCSLWDGGSMCSWSG